MQEINGFSVDPADVPGLFVGFLVGHLFGEVRTDGVVMSPGR